MTTLKEMRISSVGRITLRRLEHCRNGVNEYEYVTNLQVEDKPGKFGYYFGHHYDNLTEAHFDFLKRTTKYREKRFLYEV